MSTTGGVLSYYKQVLDQARKGFGEHASATKEQALAPDVGWIPSKLPPPGTGGRWHLPNSRVCYSLEGGSTWASTSLA